MNNGWIKDIMIALIPMAFSALVQSVYMELKESRTVVISDLIRQKNGLYSQTITINNDSKEPLENITFRLKAGYAESVYSNDLTIVVKLDSGKIVVPYLSARDTLSFSIQIKSTQIPNLVLENKELKRIQSYKTTDLVNALKVNWKTTIINGMMSFLMVLFFCRWTFNFINKKEEEKNQIEKKNVEEIEKINMENKEDVKKLKETMEALEKKANVVEAKRQEEYDRFCKFKILWRKELHNLHRENDFYKLLFSKYFDSSISRRGKEEILTKIDYALSVFPNKKNIVDEERMLKILESTALDEKTNS